MITVEIFLIALLAYYTIGVRFQSGILTALSLYVYWQVAQWNIVIIGGVTLVSLLFCELLAIQQRKLYVALPILVIAASFFLLRERISGWGLPLGFSVLSFTSVSLMVDQYRAPKMYRIFDILSYLLFFPKIFAGPIERVSNFISGTPLKFNGSVFYTGIKYLIFASFVKFVMGDWFGSTEISAYGVNQIANVFVFALGFFFDFWGYSLMAIGVGKLFGYNLSISFNRPYESCTLQEFWRRWNITLGTWLRDYIYIPLGGNRNGTFKWIVSVMIAFLISGLWHGSTLPFILWGFCHGFLLCLERKILNPSKFNKFVKIAYQIIILTLVAFLWQMFIIESVKDIAPLIESIFIYEPIALNLIFQLGICLTGMYLLTSNKVMAIIECNQTAPKAILLEVSVLSLMVVLLFLLNCPISFNFFYFRF